MAIEFIYFDLGRVLLDFTHERGFEQIAAATGISADQVRAVLFNNGLSDRYETGEMSTAEFHQEFCDTSKTSPTLNELTNAWADIFEIKPDTVALAARLKSGGNRIGILSNTCAAHWEFAAKKFRVLSQIFEPVITSYDAKSMKPDAVIYETAAKKAGCIPEQLFFVDDREENVEGARRMGWHAELFTSSLQLANDLQQLGIGFNR